MLCRRASVSPDRYHLLDEVLTFLVGSLSLLLTAAWPQAATSSTPRFVNALCNITGGSYAPDSIFQSNLNSLLSGIIPNSNFDGNVMDVGDSPDDVVHGLYYCRGDVTPDDCRGCVQAAAARVVRDCAGMMEAVIWYDKCTLRYANRAFPPPEEEKEWVSDQGAPVGGSAVDGDEIGAAGFELFGRLVAEVADGGGDVRSNLSLFMRGSMELRSRLSLEMTVQCAPQIRESSCDACLAASVGVIPSCCGWRREWVMVFRPSCQIQYWLANSTNHDRDDDDNDDDYDNDDQDSRDKRRRQRGRRQNKAKWRILRDFGISTAGATTSIVSYYVAIKPIARKVKKYLGSGNINHPENEVLSDDDTETGPPPPPPPKKLKVRPPPTIWCPIARPQDLSLISTSQNSWDRSLLLYQNHHTATTV